MDLTLKKGRRLTEAGKARIVELRKAGKKYKEIAADLDVCVGTVWLYCRNLKDASPQEAVG